MVVIVLSSPPTYLFSISFLVLLFVCAFCCLKPRPFGLHLIASPVISLSFSLLFLGSILLAFRLFALPPFSPVIPLHMSLRFLILSPPSASFVSLEKCTAISLPLILARSEQSENSRKRNAKKR